MRSHLGTHQEPMTLLRAYLTVCIVAILPTIVGSPLWYLPSGNGLRNAKNVAKKPIQPAIAVAIDMLTDDNDENDLQAWDRLSCALAASGDVFNATAAMFVVKQFKEMVERREDLIPKLADEEPGLEEAVSEDSNAEGAVSEEGFAQNHWLRRSR